jgi:hypothetical protein
MLFGGKVPVGHSTVPLFQTNQNGTNRLREGGSNLLMDQKRTPLASRLFAHSLLDVKDETEDRSDSTFQINNFFPPVPKLPD